MKGPATVVPAASSRLPRTEGCGLTHSGCRRERNEDAILTDPMGQLWAVADGMGGYGHGDVAADIVIDQLETIADTADPAAILVARIEDANAAIRAHARRAGTDRMGSTVVALMIGRAVAHVAWVGDSRAYLLRMGRLCPLTHDHSVVQALVDRGEIDAAAAAAHPEANLVTRAVGAADTIDVDAGTLCIEGGDRLMLCSDGLTCCVFEPAIERLLADAADPYGACLALVRAALDAGAPDNVSVVVVDVVGG
ncbi:PP2C family protein-serine/threonine phosphatase [Rhodobacter sp. NSM]|uniref:PP2C family protein-serine/threonine phosphatase n=1 Tax=Rhodobacter sp. NSM TaxID=3457501 RepID=UPI003FD4525A